MISYHICFAVSTTILNIITNLITKDTFLDGLAITICVNCINLYISYDYVTKLGDHVIRITDENNYNIFLFGRVFFS